MVLNNHIVRVCNNKKIMHDLQFGFRAMHSITHAVHKILDTLSNFLSKNLRVGVALIDLEKAFDSVWLNGLIFKLIKLGFPQWLVLTITDMILGRSFRTWDGVNLSKKKYEILEGLQQGTVNSPLLFNIFIMALLKSFGLDTDDNLFAIANADDLIIGVAEKQPSTLKNRLEHLVNEINRFYRVWNLRMNPDKCETIVFRRESNHLSKKALTELREFKITTLSPNNNEDVDIPHKSVVKYLGVHIDHLLRLRFHPDIQLARAKSAFKANGRIFYNKNLSRKTKIICYLLLIRPILTYAAPVWWNTSAAVMENYRVFERKCLRACIGAYRTAESGYKKFISNATIYDIADIPRIDNHIIKLVRDYFSKILLIDNESVKKLAVFTDEDFLERNQTGLLPPQAFLTLDKNGLIQDEDNVPLIFHYKRHKANKKITFGPDDRKIKWCDFGFSVALPTRDKMDSHRLCDKYWWLTEESKHRKELRRRLRIYLTQ
ncbi:GSCOCG00009029001-RA-CDS [Cotesia congregata]|nr:GSCOCG00009029001-RA-CDS [Cotesia congregata]